MTAGVLRIRLGRLMAEFPPAKGTLHTLQRLNTIVTASPQTVFRTSRSGENPHRSLRHSGIKPGFPVAFSFFSFFLFFFFLCRSTLGKIWASRCEAGQQGAIIQVVQKASANERV